MDIDFYTKQETNVILGGLSFMKCTQEEYDNMEEHDANTVYFIVEEPEQEVEV